jgi:hypothetical protein
MGRYIGTTLRRRYGKKRQRERDRVKETHGMRHKKRHKRETQGKKQRGETEDQR